MSDFEFGPRHKWEKVFGPIPLNWKYEKLDHFITRKDQVSEKSAELPLCSLTIQAGVTEKTERYNREFLLIDAESNEYKVVEPGDFVINPMNLRFGAVAQSKKHKSVLVSAYYDIFSVNGPLDASFLEANLTSSRFMYIYDVVATGSLIEKRRVHFSQFKNLALPLPPLSEQSKIAEIIATWDKSIEATERLLENSKKRKKALMQQLLTGKKRLPGFENHQWFTAKANTVFKTVSIKRNSPNEPLLAVTQDQGAIPRDMLDRRVVMPDGETSGYKLVVPGNFIISLRSFQGGLEFSRYRGLVSPAYTILDFLDKKKHSPNFFRHYFKSYDFIGHLAVAVIGIRDGKQISYDDFSFLKIPAPSIEEQEKIASFLDTEDRLIDSISRRLIALQNEKKSLMQQLLTGKKRVKVEEAA